MIDSEYQERLVQLIERSIAPDDRVEHNVQLPILGSITGLKTQCDVVIWRGSAPRQTLTIVEVQDRKSKVKPNEFRGWVRKLDEVGGQHLICVSSQEYPESIIEEAGRLGNKVRLVVLKELPHDLIPLDMFSVVYRYRHFDLLALASLKCSWMDSTEGRVLDEPKRVDMNHRVYSWDKENLISGYMLCRDSVPDDTDSHGRGTFVVQPRSGRELFKLIDDEFVPVHLEIVFDFKNTILQGEVATCAYRQNDFGELAWIIETRCRTPMGLVRASFPVTRVADGYQLRHILATVPAQSEMTLQIVKNESVLPIEGKVQVHVTAFGDSRV